MGPEAPDPSARFPRCALDMRDFNLKPPKILMLEVSPEVTIRAKIVAVRES